MSLKMVKRVASDILGVGESRIRIDPNHVKKAGEALTRDDVRALIGQGVIAVVQARGISRGKARVKDAQKKSGRRRGIGSRKGTKYSRISRKEIWMKKVRAQRKLLNELREKKLLEGQGTFRNVYMMVKGRAFKAKAQLITYLAENNLIKKRS
ncbi:50S ribosomal protein L19e [Candidatus Micrarchaeota archaeon]|nr:50S ribosomal protein L19e [Candidatus Micrarchaeota archaeon]